MAMDMFLKLDALKGESKDSVHKEKIDILAWSWGASNSGTTHAGGGAGAGKVNVQDISFTKYVDSCSHNLLQMCCNGTHVAVANLIVRKSGGKKPVEYIKLEMKECIVSSISTGGSGGEDRLTENITLNFAEFKFEYTPQKDDGSGGTVLDAGWKIAENVAL